VNDGDTDMLALTTPCKGKNPAEGSNCPHLLFSADLCSNLHMEGHIGRRRVCCRHDSW
jgi:hypothetical protein